MTDILRHNLGQLMQKFAALIAHGEQLHADFPDEVPVDFEECRVMLSLSRQAAEAWDAGDSKECYSLIDRLEEYARDLSLQREFS